MSGEPGALGWRGWWLPVLARRRPAALAGAALLLSGGVTAALLALHPLAGAALLVACLLSLDQLLLPVSYRLHGAGVSARTALRTRRHEWGEFTDAVATPEGLLLCSPVRRSLHLLVPGEGSRDAVERFVRDRLGSRRNARDRAIC
jgi:hypothetical protein